MSRYRWEVHEARKSSKGKEAPPTPPKDILEVRDGLPSKEVSYPHKHTAYAVIFVVGMLFGVSLSLIVGEVV